MLVKKLITVILCSTIAAFGNGQTINDANVVQRSVGSFNAISVSNAIDLVFTQGNSSAVAVSASDPKYIDNIVTEVKNNTLFISYKGQAVIGSKSIKAYVSAPQIYRFQASGACNILVEGGITGDELEISLSGSCDFKGRVRVNNLRMVASGSSDLLIAGTAGNLNAIASGSSDIKGGDLVAEYADVSASGASDILLSVNKELKAKASGASDISYKGVGVLKEQNASGASNIRNKN